MTTDGNGSSVAQLGSSDFERYVSAIVKGKWLFAFFGLLGASSELHGNSPWPWAVAADLALALLGTMVIWRYQQRITSVRALFLMVDGVGVSLGLLLPLIILQAAHEWAKNYWLYESYWYVYAAVFALQFIYLFFLRGGEFLRAMRARVAQIRQRADTTGEMTAQELWGLITNMRGAKEAQRAWAKGRYTAIFAPLAVSFTAMAAWNGGDGVLYLCFLLAVVVSPWIVAPILRRRIMLLRELGSRDVALVAPAPYQDLFRRR